VGVVRADLRLLESPQLKVEEASPDRVSPSLQKKILLLCMMSIFRS